MASALAITRFESKRNDFLHQIVMVDKSWFHYWILESKEKSKVWKLTEENALWKLKEQPSASKVLGIIFWDWKGVLLTEYHPSDSTLTAGTYFDTLMNVRMAVKEKNVENCHTKSS